MVSKVYAATLTGLNCEIIEVEVDYRYGLSSFVIVGLGDKSVQEAKERITSAIRNSNAEFVPKRIVVNLAPADMHKSGPIFDLSIAVGFLCSTEQIRIDPKGKAFLGELALNGALREIAGVLPLVSGLKQAGFTEVYLPQGNAVEASLVEGIEIFPLKDLNQLLQHLRKDQLINPFAQKYEPDSETTERFHDFSYVRGQLQAKRALEIAAAGGHNVLMNGVPGAGKTLLAKCMSGIMPDMSFVERLDITRIYSVSGLIDKNKPMINSRPFRSPHHTSSQVALVGGGAYPKPGEITLAHLGVLFLDEFPEFTVAAIEALRQPLEDKVVTVSRAMTTLTFPADFTLLAAMNPCKCGYFGDPDRECSCTGFQRDRYLKRISGPILDRIDLFVRVNRVNTNELIKNSVAESSEQVYRRVNAARKVQMERQETSNSNLQGKTLIEKALIDKAGSDLLKQAVERFDLSARGYFRTIKVARTIADLDGSESLGKQQMAEALAFRFRDNG